jgi:hypothetical protein
MTPVEMTRMHKIKAACKAMIIKETNTGRCTGRSLSSAGSKTQGPVVSSRDITEVVQPGEIHGIQNCFHSSKITKRM